MNNRETLDGNLLGIHWEVIQSRWDMDVLQSLYKKQTDPELSVMYQKGWGNGYVDVPKEHPWYDVDYDLINVDIHGGLTYGALQDTGLYRVGFDTAHWGDNLQNWRKEKVIQEAKELAWGAYLNSNTLIGTRSMSMYEDSVGKRFTELEQYPEHEQLKFGKRAAQYLQIMETTSHSFGGIFNWDQPNMEAIHQEHYRMVQYVADATGDSRFANLLFTWKMEDTLDNQ